MNKEIIYEQNWWLKLGRQWADFQLDKEKLAAENWENYIENDRDKNQEEFSGLERKGAGANQRPWKQAQTKNLPNEWDRWKRKKKKTHEYSLILME